MEGGGKIADGEVNIFFLFCFGCFKGFWEGFGVWWISSPAVGIFSSSLLRRRAVSYAKSSVR